MRKENSKMNSDGAWCQQSIIYQNDNDMLLALLVLIMEHERFINVLN